MIERDPPLHRSVFYLETIIIDLGAVGKVWRINNKVFKQKVSEEISIVFFLTSAYLFIYSKLVHQLDSGPFSNRHILLVVVI
jgi:hypothetical protein